MILIYFSNPFLQFGYKLHSTASLCEFFYFSLFYKGSSQLFYQKLSLCYFFNSIAHNLICVAFDQLFNCINLIILTQSSIVVFQQKAQIKYHKDRLQHSVAYCITSIIFRKLKLYKRIESTSGGLKNTHLFILSLLTSLSQDELEIVLVELLVYSSYRE